VIPMYLSIFKALKGFMSKDQTRPKLCGMHIKQDDIHVTATATDGVIGARIVSYMNREDRPHLPDKEPSLDIPEDGILVHRDSIDDIIKTTPRSPIHPNAVTLYGPNGNGHAKAMLGMEKVISCNLVDDSYPDVNRVFPENPQFIFRLDARKLMEVCKLAKTLNKDQPFIRFSMNRSDSAVYFKVNTNADFRADGVIMPLNDAETFNITAQATKEGE